MNQDVFKKPRIIKFNFEYKFIPVPRVELLAGDLEHDLNALFAKEAQLTRAGDDAPLEVPRLILEGNKSSLEVSVVSAVVKLKFELEFDKALEVIESTTVRLFKYFRDSKEFSLEGFSSHASIYYPLKELTYPVEKDLEEKFFKFEDIPNLSAVGMNLKLQDETFLTMVNIDSYESMKGGFKSSDIDEKYRVKMGKGIALRVPKKFLTLYDKGIQANFTILTDEELNFEGENCEKIYKQIMEKTYFNINEFADKLIFG